VSPDVPRLTVARVGDAVVVSGRPALWCADALAAALAELRRQHRPPEPLAVALERALREAGDAWLTGRTISASGNRRDERAQSRASSVCVQDMTCDTAKAGRMLGVTASRVRQLARGGELAPMRTKPHYLFDRADVLAYMATRKEHA